MGTTGENVTLGEQLFYKPRNMILAKWVLSSLHFHVSAPHRLGLPVISQIRGLHTEVQIIVSTIRALQKHFPYSQPVLSLFHLHIATFSFQLNPI